MAMVSLRLQDELKWKAQLLAKRESVSLNNFINATVAAAVAQGEALTFSQDRLKDVDLEALHRRVMSFMSETRL